jgi:TolB-like protein
VKQIGRELGVRYLLEGSVRKSGNRVRITAQLVESASRQHSALSARVSTPERNCIGGPE